MYQENEHNYYNSENDGYRPEGMEQPYHSPQQSSGNYASGMRRQGGARRILALLLCCVIAGGGAGVGGAALYHSAVVEPASITNYQTEGGTLQQTSTATSLASNNGESLTPSDLYAKNLASCVGITVSNNAMNVFGQISTAAASGSGFVITSDGYVATNCHVIADAVANDTLSIEVSFADGTSYPATLVGYEEDNDVAILKIEATGLQKVTLGDSDEMVVGETVYAIGNPLGELTFSLTDGMVSALDRLIATDDGTTMNMLQTNTAINPGNSGGPLFNSAGQVIGITTAKYSTSSSGTAVEGLGFAIPINDVVGMIQDLMDYGYVTGKPYMGVQITNVSSEAQWYGVSAGAAVSYVAEDGAAEDAGLEVGDIITAIDDTVIDSSSALTAAITAYKAGDSAQLTVLRKNETMTVTITFDEKNTETEAANQIEQEQVQEPSYYYGGNQNPFQGGSFFPW